MTARVNTVAFQGIEVMDISHRAGDWGSARRGRPPRQSGQRPRQVRRPSHRHLLDRTGVGDLRRHRKPAREHSASATRPTARRRAARL